MTTKQVGDTESEEVSKEASDGAAMKRKKLVLIDGHAMVHRAFHAVPEQLISSSGEHVNATFGFTSMLMKALVEEKPDYIAMTFDRPAPTFRHQQFAEYKAQRPSLPDNMRPQFKRIREMVQAFGIPIYEKDGYEADDVLGTLAVQATQQGVETIIYTGDMDTLQLVNQHVVVREPELALVGARRVAVDYLPGERRFDLQAQGVLLVADDVDEDRAAVEVRVPLVELRERAGEIVAEDLVEEGHAVRAARGDAPRLRV